MWYGKFFGGLLLLLSNAIPFCGNFTGYAPATAQLSFGYTYQAAIPLQGEGGYVEGLAISDPFFENYPQLREYDHGRSPVQLSSHADFRPSRLMILPALTLILRRQLLITPALDTRAIIFPFHSFL